MCFFGFLNVWFELCWVPECSWCSFSSLLGLLIFVFQNQLTAGWNRTSSSPGEIIPCRAVPTCLHPATARCLPCPPSAPATEGGPGGPCPWSPPQHTSLDKVRMDAECVSFWIILLTYNDMTMASNSSWLVFTRTEFSKLGDLEFKWEMCWHQKFANLALRMYCLL